MHAKPTLPARAQSKLATLGAIADEAEASARQSMYAISELEKPIE